MNVMSVFACDRNFRARNFLAFKETRVKGFGDFCEKRKSVQESFRPARASGFFGWLADSLFNKNMWYTHWSEPIFWIIYFFLLT